MGDSPFAKQTQAIDFTDYNQQQRRVLELLLEENRNLREAASAFGELAERLNTELQEARRDRLRDEYPTMVRKAVQASC